MTVGVAESYFPLNLIAGVFGLAELGLASAMAMPTVATVSF